MMKKTLVALAAVAATASFAQSSVTITGAIATALNNNATTSAAGVTTTTNGFANNPTGTSSVIFSGVEDLGGGMKGLFLYEIDPSANLKNSAPLSGEVYVGLSGGWGSLKLGVPNQPSLSTSAGRNPFGTKTGGGFVGVQGSGLSLIRMNNSMRYDSPNFGGFVAAIGFAPEVPNTGPTAAAAATALVNNAPAAGSPFATNNTLTGGGAQTDISLTYANGPLALGLGFYGQGELAAGSASGGAAGVAGIRHTSLFGQYAFGAFRLYLGAHNETNTTAGGAGTDNSGTNVGLKYDFANMAVMGNFAVRKNVANAAGASTDQRIWGLGFDYNLSKRTAAVIRVNSQTNDNPAATGNTEVRNMMAGLIHKF